MKLNVDVEGASTNNDVAKSLIKGQINHEGSPISCEVVILNRNTKKILSKSTSDENGNFIAYGTHLYPNIVMATDPYGDHNIAAQDNVK